MDKRTLYRLFVLPKMVEQKRREVQRIWERLTSISPSLTGMPHAGGAHDKIGEGVPELVEKKAELEAQIKAYEKEADMITGWIDAIDDLQVNLIFSLRFKERMSWNEVADNVGGNNTENSVRMMANRYLEKGAKEDERGRKAQGSGKGRGPEEERPDGRKGGSGAGRML